MSDVLGLSSTDWFFVGRAAGIAPLGNCTVAQFMRDMLPTILSPSMGEIVGGMGELVSAFLRRLGRTWVETSATVECIELKGSSVRVVWKSGRDSYSTKSFDYIIVTVPPVSLNDVRFVGFPDFASHDDALRRLQMGPLAKTLVHFSDRFWERLPEPIVGGLSFTDRPSLVFWYPSDNSVRIRDTTGSVRFRRRSYEASMFPGVITGSYRWGGYAVEHGRSSEAELEEQTIADLAAVHEIPRRRIESRVKGFVHKYWEGGYTLANDEARLALAKPVRDSAGRPRVFFAGEHLGPLHGWIVSAVLPSLASVKLVLMDILETTR